MILAKAFAVGILTALLAPVVVFGVALLVAALVTLFSGGFAVTGGGAVGIGVDFYTEPGWQEQLLKLIGVGFAIGFLFTLWRAFVTRQAQ
jgi:hypothetical protein